MAFSPAMHFMTLRSRSTCRRRHESIVLLVLVVLVAVWFGRAVGFEFINYDENSHVVENPLIRNLSPASIWAMFTDLSGRSYYPVRHLSFAIDYAVWGLEPAGYHLTNVILHAVNTGLLFLLIVRGIRRIEGESRRKAYDLRPSACQDEQRGSEELRWTIAAGAGAALFAIHPVMAEPVSWVSGREELLMVFFALLCLHSHQTARQLEDSRCRGELLSAWPGRFRHGLAWTCFLLACMSNAVGAVVPALVLMHDLFIERVRSFRRIVAGNWPMWAMAVGVVLLKLSHQEVQPPGETPRTLLTMSFAERLYTVLSLYGQNLKTVVWPTELFLIYPNLLVRSLFATSALVGVLMASLTLAVLWRLRARPLALAGLVWFLLALAPSAQILPHHIFRADRFLYLPMAGVAWVATAAALAGLGQIRWRLPTTFVLLTVVGILGGLTWRQVGLWRDTVSIFSHTIRHHSLNPQPFNLRAIAHFEAGRQASALEDFNQAIELGPGDAGYYVNRARVYAALGRHAEAADDFGHAISLQSADSDAYSKRGLLYMEQKQYDLAVEDLGRAIALQVQDATARFNRGNAYAGLERLEEAVADFTEAIRLQADYIEAYNNRGSVYLQMGRDTEALADFRRAVELDPAYVGGHVNLGSFLARQGSYGEAIAHFTQALLTEPTHAKALFARARAYALSGRPELAAADYGRLVIVEPMNAAVHKEWGNACAAMRDFDQALRCFTRAIELAPAEPDTCNRRGILLAEQGRLDQAIADFDRAIELNPADPSGYANRGLAFVRRGQIDRARADWQRVLELDPDGPVGARARRSLERLSPTGSRPVGP